MTTSEQLAECGPPFSVYHAKHLGRWRVEYRRFANPPPDNWIGIVYRREGDSFRQSGVAHFRDGEWTNGKRKPLPDGEYIWAELVKEDAA